MSYAEFRSTEYIYKRMRARIERKKVNIALESTKLGAWGRGV